MASSMLHSSFGFLHPTTFVFLWIPLRKKMTGTLRLETCGESFLRMAYYSYCLPLRLGRETDEQILPG